MIRFIMIGGFLGAGKTTSIGRLASMYQAQGLRVGIITNDQATDLVDTHSLKALGFAVGEVAGSCFCCNFNELTNTAGRLRESDRPQVLLAEPVGSCTDLVATVVQPLTRLLSDEFTVAPYGVILKPSHGLKILRKQTNSGFSPQAAYIFEKQLEEADFVLVNRIDTLPPAEVEEITQLVRARYDVPVLPISARTGVGFEALVDLLSQNGGFGGRIPEVDYDTYAAGEAELGWLNSSLGVRAATPFSLDELLLDIVSRLRLAFATVNAETAHLKTIGEANGQHGVANLTSSDAPAELSRASSCFTREAEVIVNARVALDPAVLAPLVQEAVTAACAAKSAVPEFRQTQCFRPGRPVPTHRYASAK